MSDTPRIALVTGGGTGIGAACCRALAGAGLRVCVHYNQSAGEATALAAELPGEAFTLQADLGTIEAPEEIYAALRKREEPLEVLVNNAGITADGPLVAAKLEDFERVVATNMRATWILTKRLARLMMREKRGRIVTITSVVGSIGNPMQSVYGMTKAALDNLTRTAAVELAPYGILVNSVAPGFIATRMTEDLPPEAAAKILERIPLNRMGTPDEVARLVRFLAIEGSYCTGAVFHVNGGMYGG